MTEPTQAPAFEQDPFAAAFPETREFWAAAERGELLLKSCDDCGRAHWYPRARVPAVQQHQAALDPRKWSRHGVCIQHSPTRPTALHTGLCHPRRRADAHDAHR